MKFDTNLRPQDKRTIGIGVYVAVVALFCWYLIRPAWIKLGDLDDKIEQAEATRTENRMKTLNLSSAEVLYDKAVTNIVASSADFYDIMDNSEIEKMGTKYILSYGLTPVDFIIDLRDGSPVAEVPYLYSDITAVSTSTQTGTTTNTVVISTPTPTPKSFFNFSTKTKTNMAALDVQSLQVYYNQAIADANTTAFSEAQCARITIVIQGPEAKCQQLIDDITKNPSIRVRGFSWNDAKEVYYEDAEGNKTLMNSGYKELKIDLNFYMADKPQFDNEEG